MRYKEWNSAEVSDTPQIITAISISNPLRVDSIFLLLAGPKPYLPVSTITLAAILPGKWTPHL